MELERFLETALGRAGSVVQPVPGGFEALLAPAVAAALEVPEEVRLHLGRDPGPGAVAASYGSGFLGRLCALAGNAGKLYRLELEPSPTKRERIERELETTCTFRNAVFRLESIADETLEYLLVDFKYVATSDDKTEGLLGVTVSPSDTASPRLASALDGFLGRHPDAHRPWRGTAANATGVTLEPSIETAFLAARAIARAEIGAFVTRMQRRMSRDAQRVTGYYSALRDEVNRRGRRGDGAEEKMQAKSAAIDAELRHRLLDIQRRYTVTLGLEPVAILALRIRGTAIRLRVQRRKAAATLRLGWNGVARELDCWICVSCGSQTRSPSVCENFHPTCADCPATCPACDRPTCRRCGPSCSCGHPAEPI